VGVLDEEGEEVHGLEGGVGRGLNGLSDLFFGPHRPFSGMAFLGSGLGGNMSARKAYGTFFFFHTPSLLLLPYSSRFSAVTCS
jgi:hypothetical protein